MKNITDENFNITIQKLNESLKYLRALCYGETNITEVEYDEICSLLGEYQTALIGIKLRS